MKLTEYSIDCEKIKISKKFAIISDLHGEDPFEAIEILRLAAPDVILAPGDIFERVDGISDKMNAMNEKGFLLLSEAVKIAPTFYSVGNHEIGGTHSWTMPFRRKHPRKAVWSENNLERLNATGAVMLDDSYIFFDGLAIGGLSTGILNENCKPDLLWLNEFCRAGCPKILLCHHPEYYGKYLRKRDIDIVVSGHAHGGQWRFFGRGVFAPGQGLFPKHTRGIYENRLVVGTGLKRGGVIPRIFNSPEVVLLNIN